MTWDATQPTNTTKIRNLGVVIRPNWQAIESGDSSFKPLAFNLNDRTVAAQPNDPTAIDNAFIVYCKTSAGGASEFYGIDEDSNVVQLTDLGRIGGPLTNFKINNFQFADTTTYTRNNIIIAYGHFDQNGNPIYMNNSSVTRLSTGRYQVTLNPACANVNYVPMCMAQRQGTDGPRIVSAAISSSSVFIINCMNEQTPRS